MDQPHPTEGDILESKSLGWISTELGLIDVLAQRVWRNGEIVDRVVIAQTGNEAESDDCIELPPQEARYLAKHLEQAATMWAETD